MMGSKPYRNGVTKAPQKCNAHVRSEHPVASTTAAGGATAIVTAGIENLSLTEQFSLENALDMIDSYSSASDIVHATHEPINAEAENVAKAAPPAPLVDELSSPPPSAAKHHAMYTATGRNDPRAIATDDLVRSKSNSFVMLGTMFWYVRLDRINGIAAAAAGPKPPGFVPGANSVPIGSETFTRLGNSKLAKLEKRTITATFAIFSRPWLVCVNDATARMVAKPAATMVGSKPNPGRVFATRCPA